MTEAEWLETNDPMLLSEFLSDAVSGRKLRLYSIAGGRMLLKPLDSEYCHAALETAGMDADGLAGSGEVEKLLRQWPENLHRSWNDFLGLGHPDPWEVAEAVAHDLCEESPDFLHAAFVNARDIFGNPFRPVVVDPIWFTPTAVAIASSIYQDRAFDRLPILADALENAGCADANILLHCRQPGEHVRGCWAVDPVLGKS